MFLLSGKVNSDVDDCWNAHAPDMLGLPRIMAHQLQSPFVCIVYALPLAYPADVRSPMCALSPATLVHNMYI